MMTESLAFESSILSLSFFRTIRPATAGSCFVLMIPIGRVIFDKMTLFYGIEVGFRRASRQFVAMENQKRGRRLCASMHARAIRSSNQQEARIASFFCGHVVEHHNVQRMWRRGVACLWRMPPSLILRHCLPSCRLECPPQ